MLESMKRQRIFFDLDGVLAVRQHAPIEEFFYRDDSVNYALWIWLCENAMTHMRQRAVSPSVYAFQERKE